jgi:hypothetical protein
MTRLHIITLVQESGPTVPPGHPRAFASAGELVHIRNVTHSQIGRLQEQNTGATLAHNCTHPRSVSGDR